MPKGYNSLNDIVVNDLELGMCPVCCRRLTAECEHRTEESEVYYAALILAEHSLAVEKMTSDPRTAEPRIKSKIIVCNGAKRHSENPENWREFWNMPNADVEI